jgi:glyceraldehyde 3-phosphate dehydrogenase
MRGSPGSRRRATVPPFCRSDIPPEDRALTAVDSATPASPAAGAAPRVALVGFDRLSRGLLRAQAATPGLEIAALVEATPPDTLAHLLRFDTRDGRYRGVVDAEDGALVLDGRRVALLAPGAIDWVAQGIDVVLDGRKGTWTETRAGGGTGSVPSAAELATSAVLGALAAEFGLERGFVNLVEAYGEHDRLADVPADDLRQGRAAAENVSPRRTELTDALERRFPGLRGKLSCLSIQVPVAAGSAVDLTCWHERDVDAESLRAAIARASGAGLRIETAEIVSSDVRGESAALFDGEAVMVLGARVSKTLTWYDEEALRLAWAIAHLRAAKVATGVGR